MILNLKRNKSMKRLFILLVLSMYLGISVFAQEQKTTQELLTSTKWEPQDFFANGNYGYVKYTKTEFFTKMKIDGELRIFNYRYYLSSSPDTVFDSNKIGKNNNGKYIITSTPKGYYVFISEILELTATKLVLRDLTPGSSINGKKTTYLKTDMDF